MPTLVALVPQRLLTGTAGLAVRLPPLEVAGFTKLRAWHARTHADPRQRWGRDQLVRACNADQGADAEEP
jgi:hypothetical protein